MSPTINPVITIGSVQSINSKLVPPLFSPKSKESDVSSSSISSSSSKKKKNKLIQELLDIVYGNNNGDDASIKNSSLRTKSTFQDSFSTESTFQESFTAF